MIRCYTHVDLHLRRFANMPPTFCSAWVEATKCNFVTGLHVLDMAMISLLLLLQETFHNAI